jgi:hypothetical protein
MLSENLSYKIFGKTLHKIMSVHTGVRQTYTYLRKSVLYITLFYVLHLPVHLLVLHKLICFVLC